MGRLGGVLAVLSLSLCLLFLGQATGFVSFLGRPEFPPEWFGSVAAGPVSVVGFAVASSLRVAAVPLPAPESELLVLEVEQGGGPGSEGRRPGEGPSKRGELSYGQGGGR
ncbi:MAG: hypothetical protein QME87_13725 [Bacillota bacterium]|nr:hypothetical protein [Bacillota bacterium]